jgi:polysaccharide export outer membrane protein
MRSCAPLKNAQHETLERLMSRRRMFLAGRVLAALAITAALVSACAQSGIQVPSEQASLNAAIGGSDLSRVYRIGAGDKLKVLVFGEQDLSGQLEVSAAGTIAMPLAGEIQAKGRTTGELRDDIVRRLETGYLKNPKISVEIVTFRPFYVQGEVRNAGEFTFRSGLKVRDAIAMAGGYTYRANTGHIFLIREGQLNEQRIELPTTVALMPGDSIRVPERFF